MLTRRFGRAQLKMPALTASGVRYQQSFNPDHQVTFENQSKLEGTVRRALEIGISHIETARGYRTSEK